MGSVVRMGLLRDTVLRFALTVFRLLPRRLRIIIVSVIAPSFTVGAIVVLRRGESVLLLRQRHHPAWTLPGGLMKRGEAPSACVRREVREELGVDVAIPDVPAAVLVEGSRIDVVFVTDWLYGDSPVVPHDVEVLEGRWFARSALPMLTGPTVRALAAVLV
ncbi:MAG: 8-oxo-dGTP diphosphatase [Frankiaceae bacterium]|nr:8-oxo-dGTP diphosphatase [Frankiaceae bacterium]MDQ1726007.1 8-oxo-dGTP diphosphatase [Frankiaceae bacterium]